MQSCRDDFEEEAASNTSAAVHGGKDQSGEPVNGASEVASGEKREVSLAEIVIFIVVILVAKKSEKMLHSR